MRTLTARRRVQALFIRAEGGSYCPPLTTYLRPIYVLTIRVLLRYLVMERVTNNGLRYVGESLFGVKIPLDDRNYM